MGWSEKLIELRNSWFSLKQLLGWRRMISQEIELNSGGRALEGTDREQSRRSYQTPNTIIVMRQLVHGG